MKRIVGIVALTFIVSYNANAQHEHHNMQDTVKPKMQMSDTMKMEEQKHGMCHSRAPKTAEAGASISRPVPRNRVEMPCSRSKNVDEEVARTAELLRAH